MSSTRWERIRELVAEALERPENERAEFVRSRCGSDKSLHDEVMELLEIDREESSLDSPFRADVVSDAEVPRLNLGDIRLERELGRGGMGVVYLGQQVGLERPVAVKILASSILTTPREIERFHREARAAARLDHPSIATVYTEGVEDGAHYFAMEFVDGPTLADEFRRLRDRVPASAESILPERDDPRYVPTIARLCVKIAVGLQHAHEKGIVHRDVKPQNIMLTRGGGVKLLDFGVSRDDRFGSLTGSGDAPGTPSYMSPEQARAEKATIDHRTDVYSLGVVIYEALTLKRPFVGSSSGEILRKILATTPLPPKRLRSELPTDLDVICRTAMAREPSERYPSAGALAHDLESFLAFRAISARRPTVWRSARAALRRHPLHAMAAILAVALAAATSLLLTQQVRELRALRAPITHAMDQGDWDRMEAYDLIRAGEATRRLREKEPHDALVDRFHARLDRYAEAVKSRSRERLSAQLGRRSDRTLGAVERRVVLSVLFDLHRLKQITPDDVDIDRLISSEVFDPSITVRVIGADESGRVLVRELDQRTGEPTGHVVHLDLPVDGVSTPEGFYRVVVELDGGRVRECTRVVDAGDIVIDVVFREEHDSFAGMREVTANTITIPGHPPNPCPNRGRPVSVASFWIDECEVSMASYREFLRRTRRPAPPAWKAIEDLDAIDEYPAVGMSWRDAQAYAEWVGKRLPSHAEWELAARGPEARLFPWGDTYDHSERRANVHREPNRGTPSERTWNYLEHAEPVRSRLDAGVKNGLYHMFGNVAEWTETVHAEFQDDGTLLPRIHRRLLLGGAWDIVERGDNADLTWHATVGIEETYAQMSYGFRCARSSNPIGESP